MVYHDVSSKLIQIAVSVYASRTQIMKQKTQII